MTVVSLKVVAWKNRYEYWMREGQVERKYSSWAVAGVSNSHLACTSCGMTLESSWKICPKCQTLGKRREEDFYYLFYLVLFSCSSLQRAPYEQPNRLELLRASTVAVTWKQIGSLAQSA